MKKYKDFFEALFSGKEVEIEIVFEWRHFITIGLSAILGLGLLLTR